MNSLIEGYTTEGPPETSDAAIVVFGAGVFNVAHMKNPDYIMSPSFSPYQVEKAGVVDVAVMADPGYLIA